MYDEWGGFFEHVPPTTAPLDGLRGFRVPCLVVSPFARRAHVAHTLFDHTSILRFIEWRWKLDPLTVRDATANNLAEALDFTTRNLSAPLYPMDPGPYASFCPPTEEDKWVTIRHLAFTCGYFG